jgi:hypothetical protein
MGNLLSVGSGGYDALWVVQVMDPCHGGPPICGFWGYNALWAVQVMDPCCAPICGFWGYNALWAIQAMDPCCRVLSLVWSVVLLPQACIGKWFCVLSGFMQ